MPEIENRRAFHDYHILETFEAGLALQGSEVKSIREGKVTLQDGFGRIDRGQAFLHNVHIAPYARLSTHVEYNPTRARKLLLHKLEIMRIYGKMQTQRLALVPLKIYFTKRGVAKCLLGLGKGKLAQDRREDLKKRDLERELRQNFKTKRYKV